MIGGVVYYSDALSILVGQGYVSMSRLDLPQTIILGSTLVWILDMDFCQ